MTKSFNNIFKNHSMVIPHSIDKEMAYLFHKKNFKIEVKIGSKTGAKVEQITRLGPEDLGWSWDTKSPIKFESYAYRRSIRHNEDGPALVCDDGFSQWFHVGFLHRTDGPAEIRPDGTKKYYIRGKLILTNPSMHEVYEFMLKYNKKRGFKFYWDKLIDSIILDCCPFNLLRIPYYRHEFRAADKYDRILVSMPGCFSPIWH